jgi:hypothetical protein
MKNEDQVSHAGKSRRLPLSIDISNELSSLPGHRAQHESQTAPPQLPGNQGRRTTKKRAGYINQD